MSRWSYLKTLVSVRLWLENFGAGCLNFFYHAGGIAILFVIHAS